MALPRFHLLEEGCDTFFIIIKTKRFVLDQGVIQQSLVTKCLRMRIAEQRLGHPFKKSIQIKHQINLYWGAKYSKKSPVWLLTFLGPF